MSADELLAMRRQMMSLQKCFLSTHFIFSHPTSFGRSIEAISFALRIGKKKQIRIARKTVLIEIPCLVLVFVS